MFRSYFYDFRKQVVNQVNANMFKVNQAYGNDLRRILDTPPPRTGRIYSYPDWGIYNHQASAPGESPAPMTRDLLNSIDSMQENIKANTTMYYTVTDKFYAVSLEWGRISGNPLSPRPAWYKTLIMNKYKYGTLSTNGFARRVIS